MLRERELFEAAVAYLRAHLADPVSVSDLAHQLCVSEATLFRCFDKCAGIGVHQCFLNLKIEAATELLRQGHTVTETADCLGFSSPSYFSACYKRQTGVSPSSIK